MMNALPDVEPLITYSGTPFSLTNPTPESINPIDIAVVLSRIERWGGNCRTCYKVAQHSVLLSYLVPAKFRLHALLHDAAEAYTGDLPRPLKRLLGPVFDRIESRINWAVCERFRLSGELLPREVKIADDRMLATERRDVVPPHSFESDCEPFHERVIPWKRRHGLAAFVERFEELSGEAIDRRLLPKKRKYWLALSLPQVHRPAVTAANLEERGT